MDRRFSTDEARVAVFVQFLGLEYAASYSYKDILMLRSYLSLDFGMGVDLLIHKRPEIKSYIDWC